MFSTYPDELPGIGLLLLRVVIGAVLNVRGAYILKDWHDQRPALAAVTLLAVVGGALLLIGYFTRLASTLVIVGSLVGLFPHFMGPGFDLFGGWVAAVFALAIASALICIGPGAWSLDARLFGRHEIVIPRKPDSRTGPQS